VSVEPLFGREEVVAVVAGEPGDGDLVPVGGDRRVDLFEQTKTSLASLTVGKF
jgi:hypothetical protein